MLDDDDDDDEDMFSALSNVGFRVLGSGDDPVYPMFIMLLSTLASDAAASGRG